MVSKSMSYQYGCQYYNDGGIDKNTGYSIATGIMVDTLYNNDTHTYSYYDVFTDYNYNGGEKIFNKTTYDYLSNLTSEEDVIIKFNELIDYVVYVENVLDIFDVIILWDTESCPQDIVITTTTTTIPPTGRFYAANYTSFVCDIVYGSYNDEHARAYLLNIYKYIDSVLTDEFHYDLSVSYDDGVIEALLPNELEKLTVSAYDVRINKIITYLQTLPELEGFTTGDIVNSSRMHDPVSCPITVVYTDSFIIEDCTCELIDPATHIQNYLTVFGGVTNGYYYEGEIANIIANTPDGGMYFDSWQGADLFIDDKYATTTYINMPNNDLSVTAIFYPYVNAKINGVDSGYIYTKGAIITITATEPPLHYNFVNWSGNTEFITSGSTTTTTIQITVDTTDIVIGCVFAPDPTYTLTVNNGTILAPTTTTTTTITTIVSEYGALYNWYAATDERGIAPVGFHVPSESEITTLITNIGGYLVAGQKLKESGTEHWDTNNGTNDYLFNAIGSGVRPTAYQFLKSTGDIWTYTETDALITAYILFLRDANNESYIGTSQDKHYGLALRFIADSGTPTQATGNDGKIYPCVTIGTQTWTAANSNETKYRNGDWITGFDGGVYTPISNSAWAAKITEAMCYYNDIY